MIKKYVIPGKIQKKYNFFISPCFPHTIVRRNFSERRILSTTHDLKVMGL